MGWEFLKLSSALTLDRSSFDCGDHDINKFLKHSAEKFERESFSRVFLMISEDSGAIVGFYTLSTSNIPRREVPNKYKRGAPQVDVPAILIGQFAIDKLFQSEGLSKILLGDAYTRLALLYRQDVIAFNAIRVDTRTDEAKTFWAKQGFISFQNSPNSLFIPVKTVLNELKS